MREYLMLVGDDGEEIIRRYADDRRAIKGARNRAYGTGQRVALFRMSSLTPFFVVRKPRRSLQTTGDL